MFQNLRTSTKLLILCSTFSISIGVTVYGLVTEKLIAIDFARQELTGSRYLRAVRAVYQEIFAVRSDEEVAGRPHASVDTVAQALADAEAETGGAFQTAALAKSVAAELRELGVAAAEQRRLDAIVLDALSKAQALAARIGDDSNLTLDPDLDTHETMRAYVERDRRVATAPDIGHPVYRCYHDFDWWLERLKSIAEARRGIQAAQRIAESYWRVPERSFSGAEAAAILEKAVPPQRPTLADRVLHV